MNGRGQGALMLAVGGVAIRLGLSGAALNYIKAAYVPLLIASGIITGLLGAAVLRRALQQDVGAHEHDDAHVHDAAHAAEDGHAQDAGPDDGSGHGHSHDRAPRVAWMLAAPLFAVLLIAPPPLGSFAANRQASAVVRPTAAWPELPDPVNGASDLWLSDYAARALYDTDLSLSGESIRLTGFVSGAEVDGFVLTRFTISCCAADGSAINVRVVTTTPAPALDSWVEVVGEWAPLDGHIIGELTADPPILRATSVTPIAQPEQPYEG